MKNGKQLSGTKQAAALKARVNKQDKFTTKEVVHPVSVRVVFLLFYISFILKSHERKKETLLPTANVSFPHFHLSGISITYLSNALITRVFPRSSSRTWPRP